MVKSISGSVHTQFCDPLRTLHFFISFLLIPFPLRLIHWYLSFLEPVPFIIITAAIETFRSVQMNEGYHVYSLGSNTIAVSGRSTDTGAMFQV